MEELQDITPSEMASHQTLKGRALFPGDTESSQMIRNRIKEGGCGGLGKRRGI